MEEINIFLGKDDFTNLKILNLSNNNIVNISQLPKMKFNNLEKLYLNSNKIIDIECFELNTNFDKLKILDLYYIKIQILKKINLLNLEELNLLNNEINNGINDFILNNSKFSNKLKLEIKNDSILFNFYNNLNIKFEYKFKDKNIEQFLNELIYNGINDIEISGTQEFKKVNYNINDSTIKYNNNKNNNIIINLITRFPFKNIKSIDFSKSDLIDKDIKLLKNLFKPNLIFLDLSNNNINNINELIINDLLYNVKDLNLSYNNIADISFLSKCKLTNLEILNLSNNKISIIDFFQLDSTLGKLAKLNLSHNNINKLVKINIQNLRELNLLENEINSGINEFTESITNLSDKLYLEKLTNSILFNFSHTLIINFNYYIKENISKILKQLKLSRIYYLKLKGFNNNNIDFLSNESLKELKELDLDKNSEINNLSLFNNVQFHNIKKIYINYCSGDFLYNIINNIYINNYFEDNNLDIIKKVFPAIKIDSYLINNNFLEIKFINPELKLTFLDYNILFDDLMKNLEKVSILSFPINNKFFLMIHSEIINCLLFQNSKYYH